MERPTLPKSSASSAQQQKPQEKEKQRSTGYALPDEDYQLWKEAAASCQRAPTDIEPLRQLSGRQELLQWRNPATGKTLLHVLAAAGADSTTIQEAIVLGCDAGARNAGGETALMVSARKASASASQGSRAARRSSATRFGEGVQQLQRLRSRQVPQLAEELAEEVERDLRFEDVQQLSEDATSRAQRGPRQWVRSLREAITRPSAQREERAGRQATEQRATRLPMQRVQRPSVQQLWAPQLQQEALPEELQAPPAGQPASSAPAAVGPSPPVRSATSRKEGMKLKSGQVMAVPQASMAVELNLPSSKEPMTKEAITRALQSTYGSRACVQIDEMEEADYCESRVPEARDRERCAPASSSRKMMNVKCRVLWQDAGEARQQSSMPRRMQEDAVAANLGLQENEVIFEGDAAVDEVDAITLKLDSDSSSILCGACLLYNNDGGCEKVVCYTDRDFWGGAVSHSGDTQVDGKSVHTINLVLSKMPDEVSQLYFTLCSCGPSDLSHFKDPSIMLYHRTQPDANLLEYSINQAKHSMSCVMARMQRNPTWSQDECKAVERLLRKKKVPMLCIDIILTMANGSTWAVQALGTEAWNLAQKVCGSYDHAKELIERQLRSQPTSSAAASGAAASGATASGATAFGAAA